MDSGKKNSLQYSRRKKLTASARRRQAKETLWPTKKQRKGSTSVQNEAEVDDDVATVSVRDDVVVEEIDETLQYALVLREERPDVELEVEADVDVVDEVIEEIPEERPDVEVEVEADVDVVEEVIEEILEERPDVDVEVEADVDVVEEVIVEIAEGRDGETPAHEDNDKSDADSEEEEEDTDEEDEDGAKEDAAEVPPVSSSHPGGPSDGSILRSFKTHIAASIWDNIERDPLKCVSHGAKTAKWKVNLDDPKRKKFAGIVKDSGLGVLSNCSFKHLDRVVVNAFIERWQPETNSFHMPFGEMTITLDDVHAILGLNVTGLSVVMPPAPESDNDDDDDAEDPTMPHVYTAAAFGITSDEAYKQMYGARRRGTSVKLRWLEKTFHKVNDDDSDKDNECAAWAYLLYLLGCTLFSDKSGTRVSVTFLRLLHDLETVKLYAWGAACLAYLYRQLGYATRKESKQVSGYLTLLEAWIYEHFLSCRPRVHDKFTIEKPLVYRWLVRKENKSNALKLLQDLRAELDLLDGSQVVWEPYMLCRDSHPLPGNAFYVGTIAAMEIVEPYHPDRVLRQFGMIQKIPEAPLQATTYKREAKVYKVSYNYTPEFFEKWGSHLLEQDRRGRQASRDEPHCEPYYVDWYARISHRIIGNPAQKRTPTHPTSTSSQEQGIQTALQAAIPILEKGRPKRGKKLQLMYDTVEQMAKALGWRPKPQDDASTSHRRKRS